MNFHIYILYSKTLNRFYIGHTSNLENRLKEHNNNKSAYTSQGIPWKLLWTTTKSSMRLAEALEFKLKNLSRTRKIKFIEKYSDGIQDVELFKSLENRVK